MTFRERVLWVVRSIPAGRVMSYGEVARCAGSVRAARQVGGVLHRLRAAEDDVPWQRVVNAQGGISTFRVGIGELQVALLKGEGVVFAEGESVDLRRYGWSPLLTSLPWSALPPSGHCGG
jgi:methylated-DNA-protein-cysteine methyltransferase-like protein